MMPFFVLAALISLSGGASAGSLGKANVTREKIEKIQEVIEAVPELLSVAKGAIEARRACDIARQRSSGDIGEDMARGVDPEVSIYLLNCCTNYLQSHLGHAAAIVVKELEVKFPMKIPATKLNEAYQKMAEKLASEAINDSKNPTLEEAVNQTRSGFSAFTKVCSRVPENVRDSLRIDTAR